MDGRDSSECQNREKKDIDDIFEILNEDKDKSPNSGLLLPKDKTKTWKRGKNLQEGEIDISREREKEPLLSRFAGNPTVGSLRDKKESCSTRRGLRVGTGFEEFRQILRGRGISLLGFYSLFKYFVDV